MRHLVTSYTLFDENILIMLVHYLPLSCLMIDLKYIAYERQMAEITRQ